LTFLGGLFFKIKTKISNLHKPKKHTKKKKKNLPKILTKITIMNLETPSRIYNLKNRSPQPSMHCHTTNTVDEL
jgi:hypothetical protein